MLWLIYINHVKLALTEDICMRTIIAGSRGITCYMTLVRAMHNAEQQGIRPSVIISGNAKGVDTLGEMYAERNNIPLEKYPADWAKFGRGAGFRRNAWMATQADALIAIWDGESRGTLHMIDIAKAMKLKVVVFEVYKDESHTKL